MVKKHELEAALYAEHQDISSGRLKDENPLDLSEDFRILCEACRRGDLKLCQESITAGANINARDRFDYTPLILASLCGHYEVVQLLLEAGALCERDTLQGERCLYNALNDRIRNLLLKYDYSKSTDPLQPLAAHITSILYREDPQTSDITVTTYDTSFNLHKFLLSARSPYFAHKLAAAPETTSWKLPPKIPSQSFATAIRYLYFGEASASPADGEEEQAILAGIDKIGKYLEVDRLLESILEAGDRRLARQRRADEVSRGRDQLVTWFENNVLKHKTEVDTAKADDIKWDRNNSIFADVLLRADIPIEVDEEQTPVEHTTTRNTDGPLNGVPIGIFSSNTTTTSTNTTPRRQKSIIFPAHRAMLLRSEFFATMFSSSFKEAQSQPHLHIIPIDCSPQVLEIVLTYLYTEKADFPLEIAIDVLFAADLLFIEKLKQRAAVIISTLGNGAASIVESENPRGETRGELGTGIEDLIDIYDVVRAGWDTRVHRLEEFGARYMAFRLEQYIDDPEFAQLVRESAARIQGRQETDTVELIDDIRYYLSDRFRLRMEDSGIEQMTETETQKFVDDEESTLDPATLSSLSLEPTDQRNITNNPSLSPNITNNHSLSPNTSNIHSHSTDMEAYTEGGVIRTLDGEIAGDEFAQDAMNYQILLGKIDSLLEGLRLDA